MAILSVKNGTSSIAGATVKGDFNYFSGGTRALGPTIVTGFRSGYDAPNGGYTVYQAYGVGRFSATVATNDTELNNILIQMGGTGTTVQQNIIWATNTANVFINTFSPYTYTLYACCAQPGPVTLYTTSPSIVVGTLLYSDIQLTNLYENTGGDVYFLNTCSGGPYNNGILVNVLGNPRGLVTDISFVNDCTP